ncbi:30S ribosomal protein S16 [Lewinella sp. 4G2]|uniref:30S ribosomal protein S16 n=1 Tax=Lewinella sp. 4G2 TaxID=1803372 RepID=UPI0007B47E21|nr:30S ribosomal protein S16 [Lewinella sp. 4G2]OAV42896.1 30S ribosomal protein S16 [Lewinella sp. 4G2]
MPVRLRLQRHGRRKRPFYHIVAADSRAPRDGKFIEKLGTYNPMTTPATIDLDRMAAYKWLTKGAQPSNTVAAILRFKGVMYYKHLMRGVAKGALTQEQASEKWVAFIEGKEGAAEAARQKEAQKIADFHTAIAGVAPVIEEPAPEEVAVPANAEEQLTTPDDQPEEAAATEAAVAEATGEGVEAAATPDAEVEAAKIAGEAVAEAEAAAAAEEGLKAAEEVAPEGASDVEKNA